MYSQKKYIRAQIRAQLKMLPPAKAKLQSDMVFATIEGMTEFKQAQVVLAFWSLPDEVCTHGFVARWASAKRMLLPVMVG